MMRRRLSGGEQRGLEEDWGEADTEAGPQLVCDSLLNSGSSDNLLV